jgi:predicted 3-demethylubiquinone-9 3-methyltransferase (glyoxalase superfamily)
MGFTDKYGVSLQIAPVELLKWRDPESIKGGKES